MAARHNNNNRLLRDQLRSRAKKNYVAAEKEPTVDEQLSRLEEDIRRLKIEFDIYFNGAAKRPPYDTKGRVETLIKRLGDDRTLTFAQRYRYNSLAARYNAFRDLWRRTMAGREEGRDHASSVRASAKREMAQERLRETFVCADARQDVATVKSLYDALVEAKRKCGEPIDDLSFPRFHRLVASKTDGLKERHGFDRVQFSVEVEGGRVSFKAKGDKGRG
ncbi:MAG TPA: MXAN_5187 C-terminal domain-containing protein [Pyrinomonadaceae bacterium]|nr:MXAN_5187 C-terminal domain-containing protein [Pyrinomonadaceae bacterium]